MKTYRMSRMRECVHTDTAHRRMQMNAAKRIEVKPHAHMNTYKRVYGECAVHWIHVSFFRKVFYLSNDCVRKFPLSIKSTVARNRHRKALNLCMLHVAANGCWHTPWPHAKCQISIGASPNTAATSTTSFQAWDRRKWDRRKCSRYC